MPLWLTTGRPPHDGPAPVGVLTEEEFNNLPEIVYTGIPEKDEFDTDQEDEENDEGDAGAGHSHTLSKTEVKSGSTELTVEGSDLPASDVDLESGAGLASQASSGEEPASEGNVTSDESLDEMQTLVDSEKVENDVVAPLQEGEFLNKPGAETGETVVVGQDGDFLKSSPGNKEAHNESLEQETTAMNESLSKMPEEEIVFNGASTEASSPDSSDTDEGQDETKGLLPASSSEEEHQIKPEESPQQTNGTDATGTVIEPAEDNPSPEGGTGDKQTTSTACAICIDEFETGEKLTLLPRCKHAFHRECIHAWLIERQGCCPLCKTDVLEPDPDNSPGELDLEAPAEQRYLISSM